MIDYFDFNLQKIYQSRVGEPKKVARIRFTHAPSPRSSTVLIRIYDHSTPTAERVLDMTDLDDFVTTDPDGFREEVCDAAGLNRSGWETDPCTIIEDSTDGEYGIKFARAIWNALVKNGFSVDLDPPIEQTDKISYTLSPPRIVKVTSNYALRA